jgi:hypothetical protein
MTVSNSHFEPAMARRTKSDKVIEDIRLVLIVVIAACVNVVNVKTPTAWAFFCTAISTYFVTLVHQQANVFPVAAVLQDFTAAPMWATWANHGIYRALTGAVFTAVLYLAWKARKHLSAMLAYMYGVFPGVFVLTRSGTTITLIRKERVTANRACTSAFALFPGHMTTSRTENVLCFTGSYSVGGAYK